MSSNVHNCRRENDVIDWILEGKPDTKLKKHVKTCRHCASLVKELEEVQHDLLVHAPRETLPPRVKQNMLSRILSEVAERAEEVTSDKAAERRASSRTYSLPQLVEKLNIKRSGHFAFPGEYYCPTYFEVGRLLEGDSEEEVLKRITTVAGQLWELLRESGVELLVVHSLPMVYIGHMMVEQALVEGYNLRVLGVKGYDKDEMLLYGERIELKDQKVAVLTDVIHSGKLLDGIGKTVVEHGGEVTKVIALVNLGEYDGTFKEKVSALMTENVKSKPLNEVDENLRNRLRCINPDLARVDTIRPEELKDERVLEERWRLREVDYEFLCGAARFGAIDGHMRVYEDIHIMPAINVGRLLRHPEAKKWLLTQVADRIEGLIDFGPWTVIADPRRKNTVLLARELCQFMRDYTGEEWQCLRIQSNYGFLKFDCLDPEEMIDNVLVAECGAADGETISWLANFVRRNGARRVAAVAVVDRMLPPMRRLLSAVCEDRFFGIFRVPYPVFKTSESICPHCQAKKIDREIRKNAKHELVKEYLDKRHPIRPPKRYGRQLYLFKDDLAKLQGRSYAAAVINCARSYNDTSLLREALLSGSKVEKKAILLILDKDLLQHSEVRDAVLRLTEKADSYDVLEAACRTLCRLMDFSWVNRKWIEQQVKQSLHDEQCELFVAYIMEIIRERSSELSQKVLEDLKHVLADTKQEQRPLWDFEMAEDAVAQRRAKIKRFIDIILGKTSAA